MAAPNNLKILSFNANSVTGKLNTIKCYVETYSPDIVAICETKIGPNFDDNELLGDGFTIWRKDRAQGAGGVLLAMNNDINANVLSAREGPGECVGISLQIHTKIVVNIVIFYRPPSEYLLDNFIEMLDLFGEKGNTIYLGDYNLPDLDWITDPKKPCVKTNSSRLSMHQKALDSILESDLKQLIHEPTHRLGNTLDLVMVHKSLLDDLNIDCDVLPRISDHHVLLIDVYVQVFSNVVLRNKRQLTRRNFNKANYTDIENIYAELNTKISNMQNVEDIWNDFNHATTQALESVPKRLPQPTGQPWITRHMVRLTRKRARLYNRNKSFPSIKHEEELEELEKLIEKELKKAKTDYFKSHLTARMEEGDSKPLYSYIRRHSGRSNTITSLQNTNTTEIPNALADHFAAVYNKTDLAIPDLPTKEYVQMNSFKLSKTGLISLLNKIDQRKAEGPDDIPGKALKEFSINVPSFVDCVLTLLNRSLQTGKCPSVWKRAIVSPIFKGGDRSCVNNYRPISLTCILCKTLEHIICSKMWDHIDDYGIISQNQHGFRKSVNTTTQLLHVTHHAAEALDRKRNYHIISFDFTKAFDRVPHDLLIRKLAMYKFHPICVDWIQDWLKDRVSVVSANGLVSKEFDVSSGVPQGSVLGPLLFLLYINDISSEIVHSDCRLYADDTLLSCDITANPAGLQHDVDRLHEWSCRWGMHFNSVKCAHMQIGKDMPEVRIKLGNELIPSTNTIKYLGVHIQSDLKWNSHVTKITAKANRSLGVLRRNLLEAPQKTKLIAYKTSVRPILEYACQVWSPHTIGLSNSIDKVQRQAVRWVYFLKKYDSVTDCMMSNDIISLHDRRREQDILLLRKIEAGLYEVKLNAYVRFTSTHNTRGKVISWQHNINQWRFSYFNRIRDDIKVYFDPTPL